MPSAAQTIGDFAGLRSLLLDAESDFGRLEFIDGQTILIHRARSTIAVVEPGRPLPPTFDVLLVVGAPERISGALFDLATHRVQILALPTPATLAFRIVAEAARVADAFGAAGVADRLLEIGASLNAERDPARVLEGILRQARSITHADAGSIYLLEDEGRRLRFTAAHNDSVDADFSEFTVGVTPSSIVGAAVLSKRTVRVDDLYGAAVSRTHGRIFLHDRSFDERFNYQTRSVLTTPMITPEGRVLGVIQLINARIDTKGPLRSLACFASRVRAFTDDDEHLCDALAAQGATALENALLYAEIEALFEGFVRASVHAIEQRDPTTSGHSQRVADLTVGLAKAADRSDDATFGDVSFTAAQLREIEYAGLLHDFGKVGVREEVLVKAKKLYPQELDLVEARFDHMRTAVALELVQLQLDRLRAGQGEDPDFAAQLNRRLAEVDEFLRVVHEANEPSVLPEDVSNRLGDLGRLRFSNTFGESITLVSSGEVDALSIRRGTLTPAERDEIQGHVTHTYNFLVRIPWTTGLTAVPEIAGKHHEYLDGTGYPSHLPEGDIPLQARMMTVADIYDALTASDRPYKKAVPVAKALDILHAEARQGKVDPLVLALFVDAKVFETIGQSV